jgi:hypothetical protein
MTEQGTVHIQMPIRTQLLCDDRLADPFQTLGLQVLNVGPMIRESDESNQRLHQQQ